MNYQKTIAHLFFLLVVVSVLLGNALAKGSRKAPDSTNAPHTGIATYYGKAHQGRKTSSGQRFDRYGYTTAHRTLPFGTRIQVINLKNGKSVIVTVTDRGPNTRDKRRILDLSEAAAKKLDMVKAGVVKVCWELAPEPQPSEIDFSL